MTFTMSRVENRNDRHLHMYSIVLKWEKANNKTPKLLTKI